MARELQQLRAPGRFGNVDALEFGVGGVADVGEQALRIFVEMQEGAGFPQREAI